jgi:hypothetical protein
MATEVQDFVEAVQYCVTNSNGDILNALFSLRLNNASSDSKVVEFAVRVRIDLTDFSLLLPLTRIGAQRSKRVFNQLPGRFGSISLLFFSTASSVLAVKWSEAFESYAQLLE